MAASKPTTTLAAIAVATLIESGLKPRRAYWHAAQVVADLREWALAAEATEDGHWPSQVEYARFAKISDRQVRRRLEDFHAAFPGEQSPQRLGEWLLSKRAANHPGRALSIAAPDWLQTAA